ncbi:hypothetical protein AVEN_223576-1 [Araneus ventricosus]|uniref:Uncharacterized protein n=1 Tax=Araneus ventricosus TaxID=182803 RepID=A0A4Y2HJC1_ARAVE|nr:hypothetical protein AVEN_223576-1 [Araneus ventricosus]
MTKEYSGAILYISKFQLLSPIQMEPSPRITSLPSTLQPFIMPPPLSTTSEQRRHYLDLSLCLVFPHYTLFLFPQLPKISLRDGRLWNEPEDFKGTTMNCPKSEREEP